MSSPKSDQSPLPSSSLSTRSAIGLRISERTSSKPSSFAPTMTLSAVRPLSVFASRFTRPLTRLSFLIMPLPYATLEAAPKSFSVSTSIAALFKPNICCSPSLRPRCCASSEAEPYARPAIAAIPVPGATALSSASPANCAPAMPKSTTPWPNLPKPCFASCSYSYARFELSSALSSSFCLKSPAQPSLKLFIFSCSALRCACPGLTCLPSFFAVLASFIAARALSPIERLPVEDVTSAPSFL